MPVSAFDLVQKGILASSAPVSAPDPSGGISFIGSDVVDLKSPASLSLTLPAHQADDFGLIAVTGDVPTGSVSLTNAPGWTELVDEQVTGGRARRVAFYYKSFTSAAEVNPTVDFSSTGEWSASVHVFRGVDATNPFDAAYERNETANTFNMAAPDITTSTTGACIVATHFCTHSDVSVFAGPAGFTMGSQVANTHRNQALAYLLDAGPAGLKSPGSWNNSGVGTTGESTVYTMALRQA